MNLMPSAQPHGKKCARTDPSRLTLSVLKRRALQSKMNVILFMSPTMMRTTTHPHGPGTAHLWLGSIRSKQKLKTINNWTMGSNICRCNLAS